MAEKRPINRRTLEIRNNVNHPRFLSLYCLIIKGDDNNRDLNDKLSCSECPVGMVGYCKECRDFIAYLAKKLGIRKKGPRLEVDNRHWTGLKPEDRVDLFEMILNDGIINNDEVSFEGKHSSFRTWATGIFNNKKASLYRVPRFAYESMVDNIQTYEKDRGEEVSNWEKNALYIKNGFKDINGAEDHYQEAAEGEIKKVFIHCYELIRKRDPRCGELMQRFAEQAIKSMNYDDSYTFTKSRALNKTAVYEDLADHYDSTVEKFRGWLRTCNNKHLSRLRKCLREHGYGPATV